MRLILFVAPLLIQAQDFPKSFNLTNNEDFNSKSSKSLDIPTDAQKKVLPTPTVPNALSISNPEMSVIGATDDTIVVFVPTTASMTITEKAIEQRYMTLTKVAETTFVSVSISTHATTLLPTIRRPMLSGNDSSRSAHTYSALSSVVTLLFICLYVPAIIFLV